MRNISEQINHFLAASEQAAATLSQIRRQQITVAQVQEALACTLKLDDQFDLLALNLDSEKMLNVLGSFDFRWLSPIAQVSFDSSIIPEGVPIRFVEALIKHRNEIWLVYQNDADPFPSQPHAHNGENDLKLHLGNGNLYRKREVVGKIRFKDLMVIREKLAHITLPPLEAG